jgi:outer membrane protein assembly factor BamB
MKTGMISLVLTVAATLMAGAADTTADWPQFRGPTGNGHAPASARPPLYWGETSNVVWKVSLTGRGRSSPIVLGNRLWLTTAVEKDVVRTRMGPDDMQTASHVSLRVLCLDTRTGKSLWETNLYEVDRPDPVHWLNSWATPTPAAEPGRVYADFGTHGTVSLDADTGAVLWRVQLRLDHQVGPGSSPLLWRDRLFLIRDGRDAQYVTALDKQTGRSLWKTDRPPLQAGSTSQKKSFSSPVMMEVNGQPQLLSVGPQWVVAYDPATGSEVWRLRHGNGFSIGASPVFDQELIYFSTGCMKAQLWTVRPGGQGDITATHAGWKSLKQVPVMSSPLLDGREIYWVADDGMASCSDARTGEVRWQERLNGSFLATPLLTNGRLYFFRQDGTTVVVKPGPVFERLSENPLAGTLVASPAVSGDTLYLRTDTHLYCLRGGS